MGNGGREWVGCGPQGGACLFLKLFLGEYMGQEGLLVVVVVGGGVMDKGWASGLAAGAANKPS